MSRGTSIIYIIESLDLYKEINNSSIALPCNKKD